MESPVPDLQQWTTLFISYSAHFFSSWGTPLMEPVPHPGRKARMIDQRMRELRAYWLN